MQAGRATGLALSAAAWTVLAVACDSAGPRLRVDGAQPREEPQIAQAGRPVEQPALAPDELRCEHEEEPLDLDTRVPRFSWKLAAVDPERRGLAQSGYRILVASSADVLAGERGDLWDSGHVASRETVDVEYAGRALRSFEHAWWKVRAWDQDGVASAWSAPARFGMGVLDPSDWRARWIGFDAPLAAGRAVPDLGSAAWIRSAGCERELVLRRRFELAGPPDPLAVLVIAAVDEFELALNGTSVFRGSGTPGARRNAEIAKVARHLVEGPNVLAVRVRSPGGAPAALCCRLLIAPGTSGAAEIGTDAAWSVASGSPAGWERADLDDSAWEAAVVIAGEEEAGLPEVDAPAPFLPPPRLLRGEFRARERPVRAMLFASALGVYSVELEGTRAHQDWFAPGWTDYAKRVPYRGYDVTGLVRAGENALGVVLADGWYAGMLGKRGQRNHYGERARFLGQLVLDYADGTREIVASDASWRAAVGPWREADLFMGERYDARAELAGWSTAGFDASAWAPVDVTERVEAPLAAHPGPEVRVVAELVPVAVHERGPGTAIFDFGQNLAGVVRLALDAPAGTAVVLRHGEALDADGSLMRRNLTWARAADLYVCKGGGPETWQPRFTYHGFRYVEVSGLAGPPARSMLTALALSSATRMTGEFRCSDPMVNRLVENARWTLRANSMDVPTDCPQRGERLGWTGDAQLFARSALWLADLQTFHDKWTRDLADAQRADGRFPNTAPAFENMPYGGPAWEDAGVLVPALVHEFHGDRRLVERQYDSMQRFVAACERRAGPDCRPPAELEGFGDWHELAGVTPKELIWLAYLARDARRMSEIARALGLDADVAEYTALAERIRASFGELFVAADGRVRGETQTSYSLALNEGLVPDELRGETARLFASEVERRGHLTTGFVGTGELLPALSSIQRPDLAYRLLQRRELPSWGHWIDQGATTLWERWDAWTPEKGFANDGKVSLNHAPLGAVVAWLFDTVAGIRPAEPGFEELLLAPVPGGGLGWAEATYDSSRGRIALRWEIAGDELRVDVTVPPNVPATLTLRAGSSASIRESGRELGAARGVRQLARVGETVLLALEPGSYSFTCIAPAVSR